MRIISGKFRSRKLKGLRGAALRPTSDRLRETLFNILGSAIEESLFIDAYAGTGAVGLEALSRGAREVFFIEKHPAALTAIRANLRSLHIESQATVLACEALQGLEILRARKLRADFVFLDPPYAASEEYARALAWLDGSALLNPTSLVIVEHDKRRQLPEKLAQLVRMRTVIQGDAALSFYRPTGLA